MNYYLISRFYFNNNIIKLDVLLNSKIFKIQKPNYENINAG